MIKPDVLGSELPHGPSGSRGCDIWDAMCAAANGDVPALRLLLERDPKLSRAQSRGVRRHPARRRGHHLRQGRRLPFDSARVSGPKRLPDMVELLLARGAPTDLADDEPWATPLAWATRRGHGRIADLLRTAGATA
jgi:ankyrin repeat protein